ncbi:MAG: cupin domain-containing protein [Pseudomonadota bacterium]
MKTSQVLCLIVALILFTACAAVADDDAGFVRLSPEDLVWTELEPGLEIAVLEGDPGSEGFYIIRARFAPGTFSAPHYHPNTRYVTVIAGTWYAGTGSVWDKENSVPLGPGSYMKHPAMAPHYDGAMDEEVIVEIRGMGPAPLVYVDEAGNPVD